MISFFRKVFAKLHPHWYIHGTHIIWSPDLVTFHTYFHPVRTILSPNQFEALNIHWYTKALLPQFPVKPKVSKRSAPQIIDCWPIDEPKREVTYSRESPSGLF